MGFEDDKHCLILSTISKFYKSQARIICIIDLNQEDNLIQALDIASLMVYRDGTANEIPPADEGTILNINYFDGE
jgi:hypothetical protein